MINLIDDFERRVRETKNTYRKTRYHNPTYIILNSTTLGYIKHKIFRRKLFGLIDRKIYKGLYIAIDNELEDYEFIITG